MALVGVSALSVADPSQVMRIQTLLEPQQATGHREIERLLSLLPLVPGRQDWPMRIRPVRKRHPGGVLLWPFDCYAPCAFALHILSGVLDVSLPPEGLLRFVSRS